MTSLTHNIESRKWKNERCVQNYESATAQHHLQLLMTKKSDAPSNPFHLLDFEIPEFKISSVRNFALVRVTCCFVFFVFLFFGSYNCWFLVRGFHSSFWVPKHSSFFGLFVLPTVPPDGDIWRATLSPAGTITTIPYNLHFK